MAGARSGVVVGRIREVLTRLAAAAPARVFVLRGSGAEEFESAMARVQLEHEIIFTDSPRSASILLLLGDLPAALHVAARHIHDQLSQPRRTVRTGQGIRLGEDTLFPDAIEASRPTELAALLRKVHCDLLTGTELSELAIMPDREPAPWRGVGPYGQGGTGMTGGVPYGRPMAETAPDRDGLTLDQLSVRIGPFFPPFPTGLVLDVKLQGDVIQEAVVGENPFFARTPQRDSASADPFTRALSRPVPIADIEMARARHHLRRVAGDLRLGGLGAIALRTLAIATSLRAGIAEPVRELMKILGPGGSVSVGGAGVGTTALDRVRGRGLGPIARAAGSPEDARAEDAGYRELGFRTIVQSAGDARGRLWQRLEEAAQSLELAGRAGAATTGGNALVEGPRGLVTRDGHPLPALLHLVPELLQGLEWGDAVTTVASLDLELRDSPSSLVA